MRKNQITSILPLFLLFSDLYGFAEPSDGNSNGLFSDIVLIGTLDGKNHGLEAEDGTIKWSMETGGCLVRIVQPN